MKVETQFPAGHVILRDRLNRAAARAYNDALFARGELDGGGEAKLNPADIDHASEALILGLALKVVVYEGPEDARTEKEVTASQSWLDALDEQDFKAIETAALKIKQESRETAKK